MSARLKKRADYFLLLKSLHYYGILYFGKQMTGEFL